MLDYLLDTNIKHATRITFNIHCVPEEVVHRTHDDNFVNS